MYEVDDDSMSDEFYSCWKAAGLHLNQQIEGNIRSWYRNHPHPPFLEHLSFSLGNQLFFIRVEDVDGDIPGPGSPEGLIYAAKMANGRACVMPMKNGLGEAGYSTYPDGVFWTPPLKSL